MWIPRTTAVIATAFALVSPVPAAQAYPAAAAVTVPRMSPVYEVSHDGRWLRGVWYDANNNPTEAILNRVTGTVTPEGSGGRYWFIRDNPALRLTRQGSQIYARDASVYLINTATGTKKRIDTDSRGRPLKPSWTGVGFEYSSEFYDFDASPQLSIAATSVSRNGRKAAFCANYDVPAKPFLYVKDLVTGHLTRTKVVCGAVRPRGDAETQDYLGRAPEMSDDGRVVHVNGDSFVNEGPAMTDVWTTAWQADSLYFTSSGKVRTVKGWGSMTRDGSTIFMRVGVHKPGVVDPTGGRVGAYNISTKKVTKLPGKNAIYGNDPFTFSAFDQASRRGRFIVNDTSVIDRTYRITTDIAAILRAAGYQILQPDQRTDDDIQRISGNGKVVVAPARVAGQGSAVVVVTDWQPRARVTATPNASASKLVVDVDPDRGSGYWTLQVQRQRPGGSWKTLAKTYRTQGSRETRTINLAAGTYRVRAKAKYGYQEGVSTPVTLIR